MKWQRVKDLSSYIKSGDMLPPEEEYSLVRRVYSASGKKYPLLSIAIYPNLNSFISKKITGIHVSTSSKSQAGDWWQNHSNDTAIPLELFDDLREMLVEAQAILEHE